MKKLLVLAVVLLAGCGESEATTALKAIERQEAVARIHSRSDSIKSVAKARERLDEITVELKQIADGKQKGDVELLALEASLMREIIDRPFDAAAAVEQMLEREREKRGE